MPGEKALLANHGFARLGTSGTGLDASLLLIRPADTFSREREKGPGGSTPSHSVDDTSSKRSRSFTGSTLRFSRLRIHRLIISTKTEKAIAV